MTVPAKEVPPNLTLIRNWFNHEYRICRTGRPVPGDVDELYALLLERPPKESAIDTPRFLHSITQSHTYLTTQSPSKCSASY
jgi:hypothetical protein